MIKFAELLLKTAENVVKTLVSTSEQISVKATVSSLEETEKIETSLPARIRRHKAIKRHIDKLFD